MGDYDQIYIDNVHTDVVKHVFYNITKFSEEQIVKRMRAVDYVIIKNGMYQMRDNLTYYTGSPIYHLKKTMDEEARNCYDYRKVRDNMNEIHRACYMVRKDIIHAAGWVDYRPHMNKRAYGYEKCSR